MYGLEFSAPFCTINFSKLKLIVQDNKMER